MTELRLLEQSFGTLRVTGPDAAAWLEGLVTCKVGGQRAGVTGWGLLLTKQGKIRAELGVLVRAGELRLAVLGGDAVELHGVLDQHLIMEDAELTLERGWRWLLALGEGAPEAARAALQAAPLADVVDLPWPGVPGALVVVPPEASEAIATLRARFASATEAEFDALRVIFGVPRFGRDFGPDDNPHDASLERRTVDWRKGCYLGQEVVCMQDLRGKVKRRLVRLRAEGSLPEGAAVLSAAGEVVGAVTTGGLGACIARVRAPECAPGSKVVVGGVEASVEDLAPAAPT